LHDNHEKDLLGAKFRYYIGWQKNHFYLSGFLDSRPGTVEKNLLSMIPFFSVSGRENNQEK
jgi:hypothetical protein